MSITTMILSTNFMLLLLLAGVFLFILISFARAIFLVRQAEVVVIERFGRFHKLLESGLHFTLPIIDQPRAVHWTVTNEVPVFNRVYRYTNKTHRIDLRETVDNFPKQKVITRDNVMIEIDALLYYQIVDPKRAVYEISNLPQAIEKLAQTTLRNLVGSLDLDETLVSRDKINEKLRTISMKRRRNGEFE